MGKKIETIPRVTLDALYAYAWPGHVRELENVIERAVIISQGSELDLGEWLPKRASSSHAPQFYFARTQLVLLYRGRAVVSRNPPSPGG